MNAFIISENSPNLTLLISPSLIWLLFSVLVLFLHPTMLSWSLLLISLPPLVLFMLMLCLWGSFLLTLRKFSYLISNWSHGVYNHLLQTGKSQITFTSRPYQDLQTPYSCMYPYFPKAPWNQHCPEWTHHCLPLPQETSSFCVPGISHWWHHPPGHPSEKLGSHFYFSSSFFPQT